MERQRKISCQSGKKITVRFLIQKICRHFSIKKYILNGNGKLAQNMHNYLGPVTY